MVFSADNRVLIKLLRQEKGYGAKNSSQNFSASQIWGKLQERVYGSRIHDVDQLKWCLIEKWEHFHFPPGVHRWSDQAVASPSSSLHSSTFWTHTLVMFDICTDVQFDSHMSVRLPIVDTFVFGGDLTKPSITITSVNRFYLNLVICLQLDIALFVQNSVKIWHCLSELWQCIQGVTFFLDTVYILTGIKSNPKEDARLFRAQ